MSSRRWFYPLVGLTALILLPALILLFAALVTYPTLPSLDKLTDYNPKRPLQVYSAEGILLGEFGEEKRQLVRIEEVPENMKRAILAAEDERFYEHGGVDYIGVIRAALSNLISHGARKQGASTITMQVARNFFLSSERTYSRKFNETLLAFKIEQNLDKDEILQLYINQIYLGQHAYGFAAAAMVYFGKPLNELTIAEMAMLAGLPKAPSLFNPVVNPKRAKERQKYVLRRMHELGFIDKAQYEAALKQPIVANRGAEYAVHAEYLAEMVRQHMYEQYQENIYKGGYKVYTTIRVADQAAAYGALRADVEDYDDRHGYRGPEGYVDLSKDSSEDAMEDAMQEYSTSDDLIPAVVQAADRKTIKAYCKGGEVVEIKADKQMIARQATGNSLPLNLRIRAGSIIRVRQDEKGNWGLAQLPQVEAAFVSSSPRDGAIYALVGGFDFYRNKFNHVTQAWRQPGSSIKPFIYSAALEKGYTPATVINDAPLVFDTVETGGEAWEPKNYEGQYDGPMSMRSALMLSKNLVSIRILQAITPNYARDYLTKFGFDPDKQPPFLTMALGSGSVTPMKMLEGYSVFANGGFHVQPYFIQRIEDGDGKVLYQASPQVAGEQAPRVIDVRNAYTMVNMMQDVVRHGTAYAAMRLGRNDLAGKTGTTSDFMDAWFCGFHPTVVAVAWLGFDTPHTLGSGETGGGAALPIWMGYMGTVLKGVPPAAYTRPDGVVTARINQSGLRDPNGNRTEIFYEENLPPEQAPAQQDDQPKPADSIREQLF